MNICSPYDVTLLSNAELCRELSQAASNRNMDLSSPGISRYSPGNKPSESTEESLSSSSGSGVLRILPTTNSLTSFHLNSDACSWTIVILIRLCIPWCSKNRPRHGKSSLWSTTDGTYSPFGANSQISNHTRTSYFACTWEVLGDGKTEPNFGDRTGWLIGIEGGNIRFGGCLMLLPPFPLVLLLHGTIIFSLFYGDRHWDRKFEYQSNLTLKNHYWVILTQAEL